MLPRMLLIVGVVVRCHLALGVETVMASTEADGCPLPCPCACAAEARID